MTHRDKDNYVLIPGSWHADGSLHELASHMRMRWGGPNVHTPDIPYHDRGQTPPINATLETQVDAIVEYIDSRDLTDVMLYGHSSGGVLLTQVIPRVFERLKRAVFHSAFIPGDGQSLYDVLPPAYIALFESMTDPETNTSMPTLGLWRDGFMQDAHEHEVEYAYSRYVVPEPVATANTRVDTSEFDQIVVEHRVPMSYLLVDGDTSLPDWHLPEAAGGPVDEQPPDGWGYRRFIPRLGFPRVIRAAGGSHELCFSDPRELAGLIIAAGRD